MYNMYNVLYQLIPCQWIFRSGVKQGSPPPLHRNIIKNSKNKLLGLQWLMNCNLYFFEPLPLPEMFSCVRPWPKYHLCTNYLLLLSTIKTVLSNPLIFTTSCSCFPVRLAMVHGRPLHSVVLSMFYFWKSLSNSLFFFLALRYSIFYVRI